MARLPNRGPRVQQSQCRPRVGTTVGTRVGEKRDGGGVGAEESVRGAKKHSIAALSEATEVAMTAPDPASSPLTICLFGPFRVLQEGIPLPPLRSRKGHWLLALLILRRQTEVERSWLAGTLWPDSSEAQALSSLRTSL